MIFNVKQAKRLYHTLLLISLLSILSPETAVGVHGFSVFFSWQFHHDKTAATAVITDHRLPVSTAYPF